MSDRWFLGIDVGTGSARAGLYDARGVAGGRGERPLQIWRTTPDHVEQSSDDIWQAVAGAVADALAAAGCPAERVAGIGFDATCSLVAVDASGRPVGVSVDGGDHRNVVVWMDHRALADAAAINATGHPVLQFVGGSISPEMQTPKLRWLKRELPAAWARVHRWFDLPDYLTWRATGCDDRSLCTTVCKWTYLGHERRWDDSYFAAAGLADLGADGFARIGARVRVPGEALGGLSPRAAEDLGLAPGTPVATALIDAHAGALGTLGVPGSEVPVAQRMAIIAGTSACHLAVTTDRRSVPGVWGPYYEALLPERWLLEAGISASGAFLDHVLACHPATAALGGDRFAAIEDTLTAMLTAGASEASLTHDLHFQPNILGNRAPLADPALTGSLSGWRLRTDRQDLARWYLAALQSLAYATRHIVDAFQDRGCPVGLLVASGGSAANGRWCQLHADALGVPVAVPAEADGVLLGAAMLGAAAAGEHASLESAMAAMTGSGAVFEPDPEARPFHDRKYRVYRHMIDDQRRYGALMEGAVAT